MTDPHLPDVVRALTTARDAEGDQPWIDPIELADAIWLAQQVDAAPDGGGRAGRW